MKKSDLFRHFYVGDNSRPEINQRCQNDGKDALGIEWLTSDEITYHRSKYQESGAEQRVEKRSTLAPIWSRWFLGCLAHRPHSTRPRVSYPPERAWNYSSSGKWHGLSKARDVDRERLDTLPRWP